MKNHIFLLALAMVLSFSGIHAQSWMNFRAENCLCKTKFPAKPELKQEQNAGYKSHQALAEMDGTVFLLDYSILSEPLDKENAKMFTGEAVKGFSSSLGANVLSQKKWKLKGWEGMKTKMDIPSEGVTVYYNTIMVRSIHYQIGVIGNEESNKKVIKKFMKSFKVI